MKFKFSESPDREQETSLDPTMYGPTTTDSTTKAYNPQNSNGNTMCCSIPPLPPPASGTSDTIMLNSGRNTPLLISQVGLGINIRFSSAARAVGVQRAGSNIITHRQRRNVVKTYLSVYRDQIIGKGVQIASSLRSILVGASLDFLFAANLDFLFVGYQWPLLRSIKVLVCRFLFTNVSS